jgi:hypothetical protein
MYVFSGRSAACFFMSSLSRGSSWENLSDAVQPRRCHRDWSCIGQPPAVQKGLRGRQPPAFAHSLGPVKIEVLCGFCLYIEKRLSILRQEGRKLDYVPDSRTDSLGQHSYGPLLPSPKGPLTSALRADHQHGCRPVSRVSGCALSPMPVNVGVKTSCPSF